MSSPPAPKEAFVPDRANIETSPNPIVFEPVPAANWAELREERGMPARPLGAGSAPATPLPASIAPSEGERAVAEAEMRESGPRKGAAPERAVAEERERAVTEAVRNKDSRPFKNFFPWPPPLPSGRLTLGRDSLT
jgi:hypothetical protein